MSALTKRLENLERKLNAEQVLLVLWGGLAEAEVADRVTDHVAESGLHPNQIKVLIVGWLGETSFLND